MKTFKSIIPLLAMIFLASFKSQSPTTVVKEISSNFAIVKDSLYFSKFEISNKDYRNFLAFLKQSNQFESYRQNLLDTSKWEVQNGASPYAIYYHSHPSYDNYPVMTVTYENANNYCKWLTDQYNIDPNRKFKKVIFRLPTKAEWVYAATAGKDRIYSWEGKNLRNKKGVYLANIKRINEANISYDSKTDNFSIIQTGIEKITGLMAEKHSFYPNEFGLYNMIGNAAEMVAERGIAKGGSYNDTGYDVRVQSEKKYSEATTEIGFRVVMEIVEK